jgi:hypothetical protein
VTRIRAALGALALVLVAPAAAAPPTAARTVHQPVTPTAAQRHVADELTSIFENGTPVLHRPVLRRLPSGRREARQARDAQRARGGELVQRADALGQIVRVGNFPLRLPLTIDVPDWQITLRS